MDPKEADFTPEEKAKITELMDAQSELIQADFEYAYRPLAEKLGLTLQEMLLYTVVEQLRGLKVALREAASKGIAVRVAGAIFRAEERPPKEPWEPPEEEE